MGVGASRGDGKDARCCEEGIRSKVHRGTELRAARFPIQEISITRCGRRSRSGVEHGGQRWRAVTFRAENSSSETQCTVTPIAERVGNEWGVDRDVASRESFSVLGVAIDAVQIPEVIVRMRRWIAGREGCRYIAVTGMH